MSVLPPGPDMLVNGSFAPEAAARSQIVERCQLLPGQRIQVGHCDMSEKGKTRKSSRCFSKANFNVALEAALPESELQIVG